MTEQHPSSSENQPQGGEPQLSDLIPEELHFARDFAAFLESEAYGSLSEEAKRRSLPHYAHTFVHHAVEIFPPEVARKWQTFVPEQEVADEIDIIIDMVDQARNADQDHLRELEDNGKHIDRSKLIAMEKLTYERFPEAYGAYELREQFHLAVQSELEAAADALLAALGAVIQRSPKEITQLPDDYYRSINHLGRYF